MVFWVAEKIFVGPISQFLSGFVRKAWVMEKMLVLKKRSKRS